MWNTITTLQDPCNQVSLVLRDNYKLSMSLTSGTQKVNAYRMKLSLLKISLNQTFLQDFNAHLKSFGDICYLVVPIRLLNKLMLVV